MNSNNKNNISNNLGLNNMRRSSLGNLSQLPSNTLYEDQNMFRFNSNINRTNTLRLPEPSYSPLYDSNMQNNSALGFDFQSVLTSSPNELNAASGLSNSFLLSQLIQQKQQQQQFNSQENFNNANQNSFFPVSNLNSFTQQQTPPSTFQRSVSAFVNFIFNSVGRIESRI